MTRFGLSVLFSGLAFIGTASADEYLTMKFAGDDINGNGRGEGEIVINRAGLEMVGGCNPLTDTDPNTRVVFTGSGRAPSDRLDRTVKFEQVCVGLSDNAVDPPKGDRIVVHGVRNTHSCRDEFKLVL